LTSFVDSSALVTIYAETEVEAALPPGPTVVSAIARVEVAAAAWTKHRTGELTSEQANALVAAFDADWRDGRYFPVGLRSRVLAGAARLTGIHGLRSLDAVHLATALVTRDADPTCTTFVTLDRRLGTAAAREGFAVVG
jgi:predicted nucleic acid-binding protein